MKNSSKFLISIILGILAYIAFIILKLIIGFTFVDALLGWIIALIWIASSCFEKYFKFKRAEQHIIDKNIEDMNYEGK